MRRILRTGVGNGVMAVAALGLGACSLLPEGPLFDPEKAAAEAAARIPPKVLVQSVTSLELGRLYSGYMLTAFAVAPGTGYHQPELRVRNDGTLSTDGFYEFDFVVMPPSDPALGQDLPPDARRVRGDFRLTAEILRSARGVRIWSDRESIEGRF